MKRRSPLRGLLQTRQIYVRSNGDVQFITVSPISQVSLLIIFLIGFLWMAFASVNIVFKDQLLELKQQKLFEARLDYENRLSELRTSVEQVNDRLLLDQKSYLKKVDEVKAAFDSLAEQQKIMEGFFQEGWFPLKQNTAPATPQKLQVEGAAEATFSQRYAADFRSRLEVVKPLDEMNGTFGDLHNQQLALLKKAHAYSQRKLDTTRVLLTRLGIRPALTQWLRERLTQPIWAVLLSACPSKRSAKPKFLRALRPFTPHWNRRIRSAKLWRICHSSSPWRRSPEFPVPLVTAKTLYGFRWLSMAALISRESMPNRSLPRRTARSPGPAPTDPTVTLLKSFMTTASQPGMVTSSPLTFRWVKKLAAAI